MNGASKMVSDDSSHGAAEAAPSIPSVAETGMLG